ncbi:MAG: beta-1,6-N-acetylglucosaminyltransferase [Bryobacteraceae bacterium]
MIGQIAYLIAAHHQPDHLAKLIRLLDSPECAFFIHIDAKVDESIFRESLQERSNVVFIRPRYEVSWGGFSVVRATLSLLSAAREANPFFQRFCLLSGSDFPIKRNSHMLLELGSAKEFMRVDRKLDPHQPNSHTRNVGFYWFMDHPAPELRALSGKITRQPYERVVLYHGSAWWVLTRDCVEYILGFLASNSGFCSFFEHTFCPDEIMFHSIVKQSPFALRLTHDFEAAPDQSEYFVSNEHGCHYIDWNTPSPTIPKVLDLENLDKLLHSRCLFARKVNEPQSAELIARLENILAAD